MTRPLDPRSPLAPGAPLIPRSRWHEHPNYPANVLLLGSHENFRRLSAYLIQETEAGASLSPLSMLYRRWIAGMRSHEAYEERKLYPYLERRWRRSFASASEGHEALHDADVGVREAFASGDRARILEALKHHDEVLRAHLIVEEDLVIPLLLSLSREEFEGYTRRSLGVLMRELDAAGYA